MTADIKTTIAHEAVRIVTGARRSAYGKPESNFARIARLWEAHLVNTGVLPEAAPSGPRLLPRDVAAFMRLMKEARLAETPDHLDSYVDLVGYALCGAEVAGVDGSALVKAGPEAGGWVEWSGGRAMPVAVGTLIDVRHRDGDVFEGTPAGGTHSHDWRHLNGDGDIMAYRVVEPEQPAKLQIEAGKFYRTRGGDVVGPLKDYRDLGKSRMVFIDKSGDGKGWSAEGRAVGPCNTAWRDDLIEEAAAP